MMFLYSMVALAQEKGAKADEEGTAEEIVSNVVEDMGIPTDWGAILSWAEPKLVGGLLALLILAITWTVAKWAHKTALRAMKAARVDLALSRFLATIIRYVILAMGVIAALGSVGVDITAFAAVFASAGLAVGLALQGSLGNVASGVMILFFRPFELDDFVTAGGVTGSVVDIGLFSSTLLTPDNEKIVVPNSAVLGNNITNFTAMGTRRGKVGFGVAYGADLQQVRDVVLAAVAELDLVMKTPEPAVVFTEMAASSLNFIVVSWCNAPDYLDMLQAVRSATYDALNEAGIEIPFDQLVVHQAPTEAPAEA